VDVFRRDGRKRRSFVDLSGDLRAAVLKQLRWPGASPVEVVDLKFVQGDARALTDESHAYMERWRFYWNGDGWKRKPPGSSLHDWNKWGPQLEHLSASEPGGKPPRDGWPPVLDLPVGHYLLRVVSLDWRSGRRDEPELEWVLRLLDGEGAGRRVFRRAPVRSPRMVQLVKRDVGRLLEVSPQTVPEPTDPAFEAFRQRVLGVAVRARVASRGAYTNLYFEGRAAGSGPSPE
jgi:hypothetical protein